MQSFIFKNIISKLYNFYFSFNLKMKKLDISNTSRCLLLTANYEDALFACGGLLLQKHDCVELTCLTNGFKNIIAEESSYEEKVEARKNEFLDLMDKLGLSLYKFFADIDENRLGMRYDKFKTMNISNFDYIFIPNVVEQNRDAKALILMLKELLKEKPHKQSLKIVMYETDTPLAFANSYVNIDKCIEQKKKILDDLKSQKLRDNYSEIAACLNKYRAASVHESYVEAYCVLDLDDFKKITKLLK